MKKITLFFVFACSSTFAFCQQPTALDGYNRQKNKITRNGMAVLGGWAAANLVYSGIATGQNSGASNYFHQMNVMWGGINLGLAAMGYLGAKNKDGLSMKQSLKQQAGIEKTYILNLGLDVAYVVGGLYMKERSKNTVKNADKFKGYGESIILQGAALFLLDGVMFTVHNLHGKKIYNMLDKVQVGMTGNGIGVLVKL